MFETIIPTSSSTSGVGPNLYRRVDEIDRDIRPDVKKYDWGLMAGKTSWRGYKRACESTSRNCVLEADLLGAVNFPIHEIDGSIRYRMWASNASDVKKRRREREQECTKLRDRIARLKRLIPGTEEELESDTDVECAVQQDL